MATSPNFSWPEPDNTDLVKNGALAIRTAVNAIDSSLVDLKGGTTGQVLAKATNTDMDFTWVAQDDANAIQNTQLTAKGALISAVSAGTPATLTVGTNGQVLTADSTTATGLKWAAAAAGGGKVLQVVSSAYSSQTISSSSTYADSGLTATITPSSASSKILVLYTQPVGKNDGNSSNQVYVNLLRGATSLGNPINILFTGTISYASAVVSSAYLDSPASTSALTYKTQFRNDGAGSVYTQVNNSTSTMTLLEIGA